MKRRTTSFSFSRGRYWTPSGKYSAISKEQHDQSLHDLAGKMGRRWTDNKRHGVVLGIVPPMRLHAQSIALTGSSFPLRKRLRSLQCLRLPSLLLSQPILSERFSLRFLCSFFLPPLYLAYSLAILSNLSQLRFPVRIASSYMDTL